MQTGAGVVCRMRTSSNQQMKIMVCWKASIWPPDDACLSLENKTLGDVRRLSLWLWNLRLRASARTHKAKPPVGIEIIRKFIPGSGRDYQLTPDLVTRSHWTEKHSLAMKASLRLGKNRDIDDFSIGLWNMEKAQFPLPRTDLTRLPRQCVWPPLRFQQVALKLDTVLQNKAHWPVMDIMKSEPIDQRLTRRARISCCYRIISLATSASPCLHGDK